MISGDVLLLLGAGLCAGYIAGLVGVGGGIIFAPMLLFYYESVGVAAEVIPSLTIGTSLFCTLIASLSSAWFHHRRGAVEWPVMRAVGLASAVAIVLMTHFVTTQPWYTKDVFQVLFALLLLLVILRMVRRKEGTPGTATPQAEANWSWGKLGGIGTAAGVVAAAAGVGGGVVLVPAYHSLLHLPIHRAVATSSATILLIALFGILSYVWTGWGVAAVPSTAIGYVDVGRALFLAVPSVFTARLGVWTAHRANTRALQIGFAVLAVVVAGRLLWGALG